MLVTEVVLALMSMLVKMLLMMLIKEVVLLMNALVGKGVVRDGSININGEVVKLHVVVLVMRAKVCWLRQWCRCWWYCWQQ